MLVKPAAAEVVMNNPIIDDVIVYRYQPKQNSLTQMLSMVRELRSRRFDLAISFDRKLRPALLCFLARIPTRVCPTKIFEQDKSRVPLLYTDVVKMDYDLHTKPQAESVQSIIRAFTGGGQPRTSGRKDLQVGVYVLKYIEKGILYGYNILQGRQGAMSGSGFPR